MVFFSCAHLSPALNRFTHKTNEACREKNTRRSCPAYLSSSKPFYSFGGVDLSPLTCFHRLQATDSKTKSALGSLCGSKISITFAILKEPGGFSASKTRRNAYFSLLPLIGNGTSKISNRLEVTAAQVVERCDVNLASLPRPAYQNPMPIGSFLFVKSNLRSTNMATNDCL